MIPGDAPIHSAPQCQAASARHRTMGPRACENATVSQALQNMEETMEEVGVHPVTGRVLETPEIKEKG